MASASRCGQAPRPGVCPTVGGGFGIHAVIQAERLPPAAARTAAAVQVARKYVDGSPGGRGADRATPRIIPSEPLPSWDRSSIRSRKVKESLTKAQLSRRLDPGMARGGDELGEGLRRTWLASERTYLAWLRTGFAALCRQPRCGKGRSG